LQPLFDTAAVDRGAPILKWAGSKSEQSGLIASLLSPYLHRRYIEPFAGSAAVFFRLNPRAAIINDANFHVIRLYSAIKQNVEAVIEQLDVLEAACIHNIDQLFVDFYYNVRSQYPDPKNKYHAAAQLLFLNRHCWNGLYRENAQGHFNVPIGSHRRLQPVNRRLLRDAALPISRASLQHGDFERILAFARSGDVVYLDPPYVPKSATARFAEYQAQSFGEADHKRVRSALDDLTRRGITFLLSNVDLFETRALYTNYEIRSVAASRRINSDSSKRTNHAEILVANFPILDGV
jgi:DNA adenine methylase